MASLPTIQRAATLEMPEGGESLWILGQIYEKLGEKVSFSTSTREGGDQIEYADQDPRIHPLYVEEMQKSGVPHKMHKYFPEKDAAE